MKKILGAILLSSLSLSSIASVNFSQLDCSVPPTGKASEAFKFKLALKNTTSAINNSGLDKTLDADISVTYLVAGRDVRTTIVRNLRLRQSTSAYGYEIAMNRRIQNSEYNSFFSLQPEFKKSLFSSPKLIGFDGLMELNMVIDGYDGMIMKSERVKCQIVN
jgi:hypothetical protein